MKNTRRLLDLREIQLAELDILKYFDSYARSHDISYALAYGTLLGAVRHKGFIPWDDDIDVYVPRPDYNRLLTNADFGSERYRLISGDMGTFVLPYAKVIDVATHTKDPFWNSNGNLFIDVFPVDGAPSDERENAERFLHAADLKLKMARGDWRVGRSRSKARRLLKRVYSYAVRSLNLDRKAYNEFVKLIDMPQYDDARHVASYAAATTGYCELIPKAWFESLKMFPFEDSEFPGFSSFDAYLKNIYGEYQVVPDLENRISHEIEAWIDNKIDGESND